MPQQPALYSDLTARRNVAFFAAAHRRAGNDNGADQALELVGLSDRADDPARMCSYSPSSQRCILFRVAAAAHRHTVPDQDEAAENFCPTQWIASTVCLASNRLTR